MTTLRQARLALSTQLAAIYPQSEAQAIAKRLLESLLHLTPTALLLHEEERYLSSHEEVALQRATTQLLQHTPLQYVMGEAPFGELTLKVASGVLIPRPETEELCLLMTEHRDRLPQEAHILDLGTGSGCIALLLAHLLPNSRVWALEYSAEAATIAQENFDRYRKALGASTPTLIRGDMREVASWTAQIPPLDLLVSNPPYVMPSEKKEMAPHVLEAEPHIALFAPEEDPLHYYRAIAQAAALLPTRQGAHLYLEINSLLAQETLHLLQEQPHLSDVTCHYDWAHKPRFLSALIIS